MSRKKEEALGRRAKVRLELETKGRRPRVVSHIDLLRMRIAAAESVWKEAKERAGQAKRRRKLAKLMAKRAQKDAKHAKAGLAEAREALAQAEAASITVQRRVTRRKKAENKAIPLKKQKSARRRVRTSVPVAAIPTALKESPSTEVLKIVPASSGVEASQPTRTAGLPGDPL